MNGAIPGIPWRAPDRVDPGGAVGEFHGPGFAEYDAARPLELLYERAFFAD